MVFARIDYVDLYVIFIHVLYRVVTPDTSTLIPFSITCVNSMEVSYIPIAKARGFTTLLIMNMVFIGFHIFYYYMMLLTYLI